MKLGKTGNTEMVIKSHESKPYTFATIAKGYEQNGYLAQYLVINNRSVEEIAAAISLMWYFTDRHHELIIEENETIKQD